MQRMAAGQYPHLVQMATSYYLQPCYDFGDEFGFGLDLILDGIERLLTSREAAGPTGGLRGRLVPAGAAPPPPPPPPRRAGREGPPPPPPSPPPARPEAR